MTEIKYVTRNLTTDESETLMRNLLLKLCKPALVDAALVAIAESGAGIFIAEEVTCDHSVVIDGVCEFCGIEQTQPQSGSYGNDVARFNDDHNSRNGCSLGRYPGSDVTQCDTHRAYVTHGVPPLLRSI